jgi:UDP-N-acetylglucosamine--N-acetylmuramyl-(pentapeptide) pyrophosphoryl-undecaprenol N-acetylglucosamine transferase
MGGFTSAPAILAAKRLGLRTFLHESNTIPGRANRWLARWVDQVFIGFPSCADRLNNRHVLVTGTPVRPEFRPDDPAECRRRFGLDPARPVVLVVGGSQGASGMNRRVTAALPSLARMAPHWQWVHLTGERDQDTVRQAYQQVGARAVVMPFCAEMHQLLSAATAAVSRAGASALSELAALRVPAVLIPYPAATDDHQRHNAQAYADSGAARILLESAVTPELLVQQLRELVESDTLRAQIQESLSRWHAPRAAEEVALAILKTLGVVADEPVGLSSSRTGRKRPGTGLTENQPRTQTSSPLEFA